MMTGSYNLHLVALSVVIAILSAYTALDIGGQLVTAKGWARIGWLSSGAISLGMGIWSMHFVGMLAFHLPVPIHYDVPTVFISVLPAIFSSGLALFIASRKVMKIPNLLESGFLMGLGITIMHYTGMAAMRLPAHAHYNLSLVILSGAIAITVSLVALWFVYSFREETRSSWQKLRGAVLMGLAVPAMHYTGMAAVHFSPTETASATFSDINTTWLSTLISTITFTILSLALLISSETKVSDRTKELVSTLEQLQQSQLQLIQSEKMSALGSLVAGVAHEINNPVNFIYGNLQPANDYAQDLLNLVQLYQKHYPNPHPEIQAEIDEIDLDFLQQDLPKLIRSLNVGAERIQEIVLSLRLFSRMDEAEMKAVNIHDGIESTLMLLQNRLKGKSDRPEIEVIKDWGNLPLVECYAGQLNQVFMNLLVNAIDAIEEYDTQRTPEEMKDKPGQITIRTSVVDSHMNSQWVQIAIADTGVGIPKEVQKRIFEPFFTTKPIGKGTGMGMSISYQIITQKHGGQLQFFSTPNEGTEFIIQIPMRQN